ncbi:TPA: Abi family protein [Photobacterium damselae]
MAECQTSYDYNLTKEELIQSLSKKRFKGYQSRSGFDDEFAFRLYLYNARLAKAFLFPIHILEVTLRNKINSLFIDEFGSDWPNKSDFNDILSHKSAESLGKGISRANNGSTDDIVSELTFDFWSNLFRPEYASFWQTRMDKILPNEHFTLNDFRKLVVDINYLRNRIAHHEPILNINASNTHSNILRVIKSVCVKTENWVKCHSTLNQVIRTKPTKNSGDKPHLIERCDSNFITVQCDNLLNTSYFNNNTNFYICLDDDDIISVIDMSHVGKFLISKVENNNDLLIDLSDYTYEEVIKELSVKDNYIELFENDSLSTLKNILKGNKVKFSVVKSPIDNSISGVIAKSHRVY